MKESFLILQKLVNELNESNSTLDKINILSKPEFDIDFIKNILKATYNPFKQYYVTSKNLKKRNDLICNTSYNDIFVLLEDLDLRKITGHQAISEVNGFIKNNKEFEDLIYDIFDRNLKTRTSEKIINKVFCDLIPSFEVALANKYDEKQKSKIDFSKDVFYASTKFDGLRLLCVIENYSVKLYSRSGNEFETLDLLKKEIEKLKLNNIVLDGEVCILEDNGIENFQAILKEYNRKNHTIQNPCFKIFDAIELQYFIKKEGGPILSERQNLLKKILSSYSGKYLNLVNQERIVSNEHLKSLTEHAAEMGWEGIMIRRDVPYEGKRSNNLLKCKSFFDAEYIVKSLDIGPFRVIVEGKEVTEHVMRNVIINHKGFDVAVGSGFSIYERRYFRDNPQEIIGKEITVKYFSESSNQNGELSLRFPTVKAIYKEKRDI